MLAGSISLSATENEMQHRMRVSATFKNLRVRVSLNNRTTATEFRLRKGAANGNLLVSVAGGATGTFEDTVNTDSVVSGDLVNFSVVTSTGSETLTSENISVESETSDGKFHTVAGVSGISYGASVTTYMAFGGHNGDSTTENDAKILMDIAGVTSSFLACNVRSNNRSDATDLRTRKNGANGGQSLSVGASATGFFEDAVNTDSLGVSDEFNLQAVTGAGTGTIVFRYAGVVMAVAVDVITPPVASANLSGQAGVMGFGMPIPSAIRT